MTSTGKAFQFLSTPSARRATARRFAGQCPDRISIHALREEGDAVHGPENLVDAISIHALREEGDAVHGPENLVDAISIHALREEGDWAGRAHPSCRGYFYPRPPRGGRLI